MKIVRNSEPAAVEKKRSRLPAWKVLVVDDEPDVRRLTALNLRGFEFAGRPLELIEAATASEAREHLRQHPDFALALIDVVMESDDSGLTLVEFIRNEMNNRMIRLVIRTGQPGIAPERFVIDHFDIDDYKDKTELTVQKLYTTVRSAIKGYRDLQTIEMNRLGLARILDVTPELYNLHCTKLEEYFRGVLTQIISLCNLGSAGMISSIDGLMATVDGGEINIRAEIGEFGSQERLQEITDFCSRIVLGQEQPHGLRQGALVAPLRVGAEVLGFVYLEPSSELAPEDRELIQVMTNQCAGALDNLRLHHSLEDSYDEAIDMLADVAEYKDSATGQHIHRLQEYTRRIAKAMGYSDDDADALAKASRLHDVGKVGIPDNILRKQGKLTPEEYVVIQRHTRIGDAVLSRSHSLDLARTVARAHHEHWDGGGYPNGLAGDEIPFGARMVAVADVFDALVSSRPYKEPWLAEKAIAEIMAGQGSQFDPQVTTAFLKLYQDGAFDDLIAAATKESLPTDA